MRKVTLASIGLGLLWNALAVWLLGGRFRDVTEPAWLAAGIIAGVAAGRFTVWSRVRRGGDESFSDVMKTFYLGMFVYWLAFIAIERALMCIRFGGWTDFDLHDHLSLILVFVVHGTLVYGVVLVPLTLLSRQAVWKIYAR